MTARVDIFKLILVGDSNVGKTSWIKKVRTDVFEENHIVTLGVEIHPIMIETTNGRTIVLNVWDISGGEKYKRLRNSYYEDGDCVIAMFDLSNNSSHDHLEKWVNEVLIVRDRTMPYLYLGNKMDLDTGDRVTDIKISTKKGTRRQLLRPFLHLARTLTNDHSLQLK
jgi:GTP-binding nuclear protein Ran